MILSVLINQESVPGLWPIRIYHNKEVTAGVAKQQLSIELKEPDTFRCYCGFRQQHVKTTQASDQWKIFTTEEQALE